MPKAGSLIRHPLTALMSLLLCACSFQWTDALDPILSMQIHTPRPIEGDWQEGYAAVVAFDGSSSMDDTACAGFELWIAQYTSAEAPADCAVHDYRIDSMSEVDDPFFAEDYDAAFLVEYSVRPVNIRSPRWVAGDGRLTDDGWMVGKVHYLGISIRSGSARIHILGPCPMC